MASIKISGRMKVKTLKEEFKKEFGFGIRIYNGVKFADDDVTLASIRKGDAKGGDVEIRGNMKVGNAEKLILDNYGIKIQIEDKTGALADNNVTLGSLKSEPSVANKEDKQSVIGTNSQQNEKYVYTITLEGDGCELALGSIDDDTWNYIEEEYDGDAESYCSALDNEEVPEEFSLAGSTSTLELYEHNDLGHYYGCTLDGSCTITIEDKNNKCVSSIEIEGSNLGHYRNQIRNYICPPNIDDCNHYMLWCSSENDEMTCRLELDEPFDFSKLQLVIKEVDFHADELSISFIEGVKYESQEKEFILDESSSNGDPEVEFYSVLDEEYDDDEEDDDE